MFLATVLKSNAVFSAICGILCLVFSSYIANLMGEVSSLILIVLGAALLVFAADVFVISKKLPNSRKFAVMVFWADLAWVVLTPVVIAVFYAQLSSLGVMLLADIALIVLVFAVLEWLGLRKLDSDSAIAAN